LKSTLRKKRPLTKSPVNFFFDSSLMRGTSVKRRQKVFILMRFRHKCLPQKKSALHFLLQKTFACCLVLWESPWDGLNRECWANFVRSTIQYLSLYDGNSQCPRDLLLLA
jgi:hypothetical protein